MPVCQKYGAYVYLDKLHSISALDQTGRGFCEYCGVDPTAVDVMMGTFTKNYGAMGGYVAADRNVVRHLWEHATGSGRHESMSPIVFAQVLTALQVGRRRRHRPPRAVRYAVVRPSPRLLWTRTA